MLITALHLLPDPPAYWIYMSQLGQQQRKSHPQGEIQAVQCSVPQGQIWAEGQGESPPHGQIQEDGQGRSQQEDTQFRQK